MARFQVISNEDSVMFESDSLTKCYNSICDTCVDTEGYYILDTDSERGMEVIIEVEGM